jgi:hypothetical protein
MSKNGSPSAGPGASSEKLPPPAPFIVTAELPPDILAWADRLRKAHYPPERNRLAAHVTLFHAFAPSLYDELRGVLSRMASQTAPPAARIDGPMSLGKGTAIAISSLAMLAVRQAIANHFHGSLTAQDQHPPRLHITVQNKVTSQAARALQEELAPTLGQRPFAFAGLALHLYRDTHWEALGRWPFRGKVGG